ncbi:hypothetical protein GCM10027072_35920 [Streptomyces bullii]
MTGGFLENLSVGTRPRTFGHPQWLTGRTVGSLQKGAGPWRKPRSPEGKRVVHAPADAT